MGDIVIGRTVLVAGATGSLDTAPYLERIAHLGLALALGLLIGLERERRGKQAGLRTFGFVALIGAAGAVIGPAYGAVGFGLTGVLVGVLSVESMLRDRAIEGTTMAALPATCLVGVLAGQGHVLTPTTLAVVVAGLLAWKEELAGFTLGLTTEEVRSAILLAVLAFVVYPLLPSRPIGPDQLLNARVAWLTVILLAAVGMANYVLLKLYGNRGIVVGGFLAGLINSTVAAVELARRVRDEPSLATNAFTGIVLSTSAMAIRNAAILGVIAAPALVHAAPGLAVLAIAPAVVGVAVSFHGRGADGTKLAMASPFSLSSALRFGAVFLALQLAGGLAEQSLGHTGFYAVAVIGGFVSSASAVGSAATLAAHHTISYPTAALGAVIASSASTIVSIPLVARTGHDRALTARTAITLAGVAALATLVLIMQAAMFG